MKTNYFIPILLVSFGLQAQNGIDELLAAGIEDAKRFSDSYISPAAEGVVFGLSNGWYHTAKGKNPGDFEIAIIGNASFVKEEQKSFTLNTAEYNFLRFQDPSQETGTVATALGENNPDITMIIEYENELGMTEHVEITLPQGIGSAGVNVIPTAYLQLGVGVYEGTEVKLRYLPKIDQEGVELQVYGGALQHELTSWLPGAKNLPIAIGLLVGYSHLDAEYQLSDNSTVEGDNQRIETKANSWLLTTLVSTEFSVVNFYGGLGYVFGNSQSDLLGSYRVQTGILQSQILTDPYSVENNASGLKASLGAKLELGFFSLHADYSFQKFNNASVGLGFAF